MTLLRSFFELEAENEFLVLNVMQNQLVVDDFTLKAAFCLLCAATEVWDTQDIEKSAILKLIEASTNEQCQSSTH